MVDSLQKYIIDSKITNMLYKLRNNYNKFLKEIENINLLIFFI
jgi:hypothetical protein